MILVQTDYHESESGDDEDFDDGNNLTANDEEEVMNIGDGHGFKLTKLINKWHGSMNSIYKVL